MGPIRIHNGMPDKSTKHGYRSDIYGGYHCPNPVPWDHLGVVMTNARTQVCVEES